jgi:hypothetical protein
MSFVIISRNKISVPSLTTVLSAIATIEGITVVGNTPNGSDLRIDYTGVLGENRLRDALNAANKTTGTTNWTYQWGD